MSMEGALEPDGLPLGDFKTYAHEKLHYAGHYMGIFAVGMSRLWPRRTYLDLMAGAGRCLIDGQHFEGSALRSLRAPFTRRILVEQNPELAAALKVRVGESAEVLTESCNADGTIAKLRAATSQSLSLAFVDNLGLDVTLRTLKILTQDRKMDLMIVFQLQEITRNVRAVMAGDLDLGPKWDAFFGTHEWRQVVTDLQAQGALPAEVAEGLLAFYIEQLKSIGYEYTEPGIRVMKNSRNASQYRLILAAKDARAQDFFSKIQKIEYSGQRTLLD